MSFDSSPVEQKPCFPGGYDKILSWIGKNLIYPTDIDESCKGLISFTVNEAGKVVDVEVYKNSCGTLLDSAAIDVVKKLPFTCPGLQMGKPVKVKMIVPVSFYGKDK